MIVAILADDDIKREITEKGVSGSTEIVWADSLQSLRIIEADAYFDLLFENDQERVERLKFLLPKPVFVNDVTHTHSLFIRINAWPTMMSRNTVEIVAGSHQSKKINAGTILNALGWSYHDVPDIPGMVTPRIVSMIINEAYYALGEGVSSRQEIDLAMKLGTNYPYGPFEWCEKIGIEKIRQLLVALNKTDGRYTMAPLLNNE